MDTRKDQPTGSRARAAIRATISRPVEIYDRSRLSRLVAIDPARIPDGREGTHQVLARIASALRSERARAGHWNYDLNRHLGLMQALAAERARLLREIRDNKKGPPKRRP